MVECELIDGTVTIAVLEVLIDTWWNVNEYGIEVSIWEEICFNRYMVECECGDHR